MPFNNGSDAEKMAKSAAVAEAFTQELYDHILSLIPTPAAFAELHNRMETSYPAALKGDPEKVKAFEADLDAVNSNLSLLHALAKVVAVKDATVPDSLGLGRVHEKTVAAAVHLGNPQGFNVLYDPKGQLFGTVTKVKGAKGYQIWACDGDPSLEANWKMIASSSNCRRIAIMGLNRSKFNMLKVRAMRGTGPGPWSNLVSLDPTQ